VSNLEAELAHNTSYLASFRTKAESARGQLDFLGGGIAELKAKIAVLQENLRRQDEEGNPYREQIATLRRQLDATDTRLAELDTLMKKIQRIIERKKSWVKGFKDVKLFVIEEIITELELATNTLLPESGLQEWSLHYAVEKESKSGTVTRGLNVTIISPNNQSAVRWENWSGGEGQRLRIVGALALAEVLLGHAGINCNLEILDEPTRHLSPEGVVDLCEYLADRAAQLRKVCLFVDHMAVESTRFASVTTVTKTADGSLVT